MKKDCKDEIHFMHRAFLNDPGFENVIEQRKYFVICFLMKLCKQWNNVSMFKRKEKKKKKVQCAFFETDDNVKKL